MCVRCPGRAWNVLQRPTLPVPALGERGADGDVAAVVADRDAGLGRRAGHTAEVGDGGTVRVRGPLDLPFGSVPALHQRRLAARGGLGVPRSDALASGRARDAVEVGVAGPGP